MLPFLLYIHMISIYYADYPNQESFTLRDLKFNKYHINSTEEFIDLQLQSKALTIHRNDSWAINRPESSCLWRMCIPTFFKEITPDILFIDLKLDSYASHKFIIDRDEAVYTSSILVSASNGSWILDHYSKCWIPYNKDFYARFMNHRLVRITTSKTK